jgi:hypothetical protein
MERIEKEVVFQASPFCELCIFVIVVVNLSWIQLTSLRRRLRKANSAVIKKANIR